MDWLRSEDLKEEKEETTPAHHCSSSFHFEVGRNWEGVTLGMLRMNLGCFEPGLFDQFLNLNVFLREDPEEEDDEEEGEPDDDEDDNDGDAGYSE